MDQVLGGIVMGNSPEISAVVPNGLFALSVETSEQVLKECAWHKFRVGVNAAREREGVMGACPQSTRSVKRLYWQCVRVHCILPAGK